MSMKGVGQVGDALGDRLRSSFRSAGNVHSTPKLGTSVATETLASAVRLPTEGADAGTARHTAPGSAQKFLRG
jgi:hypothetical protein